MATFTTEELTRRQQIGLAAILVFALGAGLCHLALMIEAGVPEFLEAGRGAALALALVAACWTGLATALKALR